MSISPLGENHLAKTDNLEKTQTAPHTSPESGVHQKIRPETRSFSMPSFIDLKNRVKSSFPSKKDSIQPIKIIRSDLADQETQRVKNYAARNSIDPFGSLSSDMHHLSKWEILKKIKELFGFGSNKRTYNEGEVAQEIIKACIRLNLQKNEDREFISVIVEGVVALQNELNEETTMNRKKIDIFYSELMLLTEASLDELSSYHSCVLSLICQYGKKDLHEFPKRISLHFNKEFSLLEKLLNLSTENELRSQTNAHFFREMSLCGTLSMELIHRDRETQKFLAELKSRIETKTAKDPEKIIISRSSIAELLKIQDHGVHPPEMISKVILENQGRFTSLTIEILEFILEQRLSNLFRTVVDIRCRVILSSEKFCSFINFAASDLIFLRFIGPFLARTLASDKKYLNPLKRAIIKDIAIIFQKFSNYKPKDSNNDSPNSNTIHDFVLLKVFESLKEKYQNFLKANFNL